MNSEHHDCCPCKNARCHPPCSYCICKSLKPKPRREFMVALKESNMKRERKLIPLGATFATEEAAKQHLQAQRRLVYGPDAPLTVFTREVSEWEEVS